MNVYVGGQVAGENGKGKPYQRPLKEEHNRDGVKESHMARIWTLGGLGGS
jgi:hypothetical protein